MSVDPAAIARGGEERMMADTLRIATWNLENLDDVPGEVPPWTNALR